MKTKQESARLSDDYMINLTEQEQVTKPTKIAGLIQIFKRELHFAIDDGRRLYYYKDGVYHPRGTQFIEEVYIDILESFGKTGYWKSYTVNELIRHVKGYSPRLWERPPIDKVNLLNGILNLETMTLEPHTPEFYSPIQIPVKYDRKATCPHWEKFVSSVFPPGAESLAWELIALLLVPYTKLQKTILLIGKGANGKSTFLNAVEQVIGQSNVSHVSLHQLEEDKFSRAGLVGKLANIFSDLPLMNIKNVNFFKALTGEDSLQIEYKFGEPFFYKPFTRLVFSANTIPNANDDTAGWLRRWLIIPFVNTFKPNPGYGDKLENLLALPQELSGVLNKAIAVIWDVMERGLQVPAELANQIESYTPVPTSLEEWAKEYLRKSEGSWTSRRALWKHYIGNVPVPDLVNKTTFISCMKVMFPDAKYTQRRREGTKIHGYSGIKLFE